MKSYSYNEIKNFKINQEFYESSQYCNIKAKVKIAPIETFSEVLKSKQLIFIASVEGSEDIEYLFVEMLMHYSPNLYDYPAYVGVKNIGFNSNF